MRMEVSPVPTLAPIIIGRATARVMLPESDREISRPMVAAEAWTTPVNAAPTSTATRGLWPR